MTIINRYKRLLTIIDSLISYIEEQYGYKRGSSKRWEEEYFTIYLYKDLSTVTLRYFLKVRVLRISYFSYPSLFESFTVESIKVNPDWVDIESLKKFVDDFMMKVFFRQL